MKPLLPVRSIAILLFVAGVAGAAHAQNLQDGQAVLSVDGADLALLPLAVDADGNDQDPIVYDLGVPEVRMIVGDASEGAQRRYKDPLFCFDFGSGQGAAATLSVRDANGHVVVSDVGVPGQVEHLLTASQQDVPTQLLTPSGDVQCFYRGLSSEAFGLFGVPSQSGNSGELFSDAFQAVPNLGLTIDAREFANPGEVVTITMELVNDGNLGLDRIAFQELYPWLENFYDASLTSGTWNCSAIGGAVCPPTGGSENADSLRFGDLSIPVGGELEFVISRFVRGSAEPGTSINLFAGVVGVSETSVAASSAEHVINVIGEGESLTASDLDMTAGESATLTVTAVDGSGFGVPGVDVSIDSDGGLTSLTPVNGTETDGSGEVRFEVSETNAASYQPEFTASGLNPATPTVDVAPAAPDSLTATLVSSSDPVADGIETGDFEVEVRDVHNNLVSGVTVEVSQDDGLDFGSTTESPTNSQGVASFSASTTDSGTYTVEFAIAGVATANAPVTFVAGPAEKLAFLPDYQPVDTPVDEPLPDLKVEVLDSNDNRATDYSGSVNLLVTQPVFEALDSVSADQGLATFSGVTFSQAGPDYILQATASGLSSDDSDPFEVLESEALDVELMGFLPSYEKGASEAGEEVVQFTYTEGAGNIEQIFNVFRVIDNDTGDEIDPGTYDALFESIAYGPPGNGNEDYIRGLSGTTADNVVSPDTRTIEVYFTLETTAPEGDYQLTLTSYDVTGEVPSEVSLDDANAGEYDILVNDATDVIVDGGP